VRSGQLLHRDDDADDMFVAHLTMASGCAVSLVQSASSWGPPRSVTHVAGDRGSVWIDDGVWLADADDPSGHLVEPPPIAAQSGDPRHRFTHLELGPFTDLCRAFASAIEGEPITDAATFADGCAAQRVLDALRRE